MTSESSRVIFGFTSSGNENSKGFACAVKSVAAPSIEGSDSNSANGTLDSSNLVKKKGEPAIQNNGNITASSMEADGGRVTEPDTNGKTNQLQSGKNPSKPLKLVCESKEFPLVSIEPSHSVLIKSPTTSEGVSCGWRFSVRIDYTSHKF